MSSCVTKHIDEFCDKFLSLNVSFGPESEFVVEVETLGSGTIPIESEVFQKYLPGTGSFTLLEETFKKSSGGVTTNSKFSDPVAKSFKTDTVGTLATGGDYVLGMEYFTIQGIPTHFGESKNLTVTRQNYVRNIFPNLDRKKDGKSLYYMGVDGRLRVMDTNDEQQKQHVPGYPNPYTEFGQYYYWFPELALKVGLDSYDFKTGNKLADGVIEYPQGYFADSGTIQSVANSLLSGSKAIAIGSSLFGGYKVIEASSDLGKIDVLHEVGIRVPDEAESSSITKSYADSYSSGAQVLTRTTGRLPDVTQEKMGAVDPQFQEVGYTVKQNQDSDERPSTNYTLTSLSPYGKIDKDKDKQTYIWAKIKDLGVVREYGLALSCEKNATPINESETEFIEKTYGKTWLSDAEKGITRKIYYNAEVAITQGNAFEEVRLKKLSKASTSLNEGLFYSKITNHNRYWQSASPGGGNHWSMNGDIDRDPEDPDVKELVGFQNFGSADNPTGEKTWKSPSGGQISFLEYDAPLEGTAFSDIKLQEGNDMGTIGDLVGKVSEPHTSGVIIVDFGPATEPSFSGLDKDFTKHECIVDFSPATFLPNGTTRFGGLASIDVSGLEGMVADLIEKHGEIFDSILDQNPSRPDPIYNIGPEDYDLPRTALRRIASDDNNKGGYWGSRFINRRGPHMNGCRSNRDRYNRNDSFSVVDFNINTSDDGNNLYIGGGDEGVAWDTVNRTCKNQVDIEYVEKINFTLINKLYDFEANPFHLRFLEGASIVVVNGKLKASYTFSQKPYIPNYGKIAEGSAAARRFIGYRHYFPNHPVDILGNSKGVVANVKPLPSYPGL